VIYCNCLLKSCVSCSAVFMYNHTQLCLTSVAAYCYGCLRQIRAFCSLLTCYAGSLFYTALHLLLSETLSYVQLKRSTALWYNCPICYDNSVQLLSYRAVRQIRVI